MPAPAATALFALIAILVLAALGYGIYQYFFSDSSSSFLQSNPAGLPGGETSPYINRETPSASEPMNFCPQPTTKKKIS